MNNLSFEQHLRREGYAENTILSYRYAAREFLGKYGELTRENLLLYRAFLSDSRKPQTVNLRIRAMNKYVAFLGHPEWKVKGIRMPRLSYLDNVISQEEYASFKKALGAMTDRRWYFCVRFMAMTGVRISELVRIRVEHVRAGYMDICSKGGKVRRIYFPDRLRQEALLWLQNRPDGPVFLNRRGQPMTGRGIAKVLKELAVGVGLNPAVVHPHAFRHLFAKNFLGRQNDIVLLADLLGHESVETTRIYLQRSSREQCELINRVVDW